MTTLTISDSLVASMAKAIREWDGCSNKDCVKGCKAFSEQDPEYVCGRQTHDYLNAIMPAFQAQMDSALLSERESATKAERERWNGLANILSATVPTRYERAEGLTLPRMVLNRSQTLVRSGDCVLVWVNEGDLNVVGAIKAIYDRTAAIRKGDGE